MSATDLGLGDLESSVLEDAWYELEGAFEVYSIGRCRFVLVHCRTAMLISIVILAKRRGLPFLDGGIDLLGRRLGMPEQILESCGAIDQAGRYESILNTRSDEQEKAETILSKTLEAFEWIRGEMGTG